MAHHGKRGDIDPGKLRHGEQVIRGVKRCPRRAGTGSGQQQNQSGDKYAHQFTVQLNVTVVDTSPSLVTITSTLPVPSADTVPSIKPVLGFIDVPCGRFLAV